MWPAAMFAALRYSLPHGTSSVLSASAFPEAVDIPTCPVIFSQTNKVLRVLPTESVSKFFYRKDEKTKEGTRVCPLTYGVTVGLPQVLRDGASTASPLPLTLTWCWNFNFLCSLLYLLPTPPCWGSSYASGLPYCKLYFFLLALPFE